STIREQAAGDGRHFLYLGLGYTIAVRDVSLPFEVRTRFLAPVFGTNQHLFQRVEISGKVEIPVAKP
ncbi:MAG: hypothetical protein LBK27_08300, partial [Treponema sp.]|nr:hypothetical protein [Treponema sp.]